MKRFLTLPVLPIMLGCTLLHAQNPLIMDQFTADPTARVFEGRMYVYPSHDINCGTNWFCMQDYHVFSSENLVDWTDHGMIVTQEKVPWVDSARFAMWAPDCFERNGTYYFYFPAIADSSSGTRGMAVGVALSDSPSGPFKPETRPIGGVHGIDPNVFTDHDGQAYLYWAGMGNLMGARLKENMIELASEPVPIKELPKGMKEGPFVFERNGIYYFTFPHVIENTEALVYAMGNGPLGPFEYKGILMDEHPSGCWTNHHSIVEYGNQWYLFYHHNDLSPHFDKNRSVRADSLFFNADGTIRKVIPTLRGVGLTPASSHVQVDRYSAISEKGAEISFLDTTDVFRGWKTGLSEESAWISYKKVDFGNEKRKHISLRVASATGGTLEVHFSSGNSEGMVEVGIPENTDWTVLDRKVRGLPSGIQDIRLVQRGPGNMDVDWISFH